MADVKFEVVTLPFTSTGVGGTYDVTVAGFGTPKAVLVFWTLSNSVDAVISGLQFGIGLVAGNGQSSCSIESITGSSTSNVERAYRNDRCFSLISGNQEVTGSAFNSFITDGARFEVTTSAASGRFITYVLIGGADLTDAYFGEIPSLGTTTSPTVVSSVGFEPDITFMSGIGSAASSPTYENELIVSWGAGLNDGLDTQKSTLIGGVHNRTSSLINAFTGSGSICGKAFDDAIEYLGSIHSYTASGFSITTTASAGNDRVSFLCLKYANSPDIALFDTEYPTSGDYAETGIGFEPSFGMITSLDIVTRDTLATTSNFGLAITSFTDSSINSSSVSDRDGVTTKVTRSLSASEMTSLGFEGVQIFEAPTYAFNPSGWEFQTTTHPSTPILGWGLAVGGGGAPPVGIQEMYVNIGGTFTKATPSVLVGGVWQPADAYVLVAGVWKPIYEQ